MTQYRILPPLVLKMSKKCDEEFYLGLVLTQTVNLRAWLRVKTNQIPNPFLIEIRYVYNRDEEDEGRITN